MSCLDLDPNLLQDLHTISHLGMGMDRGQGSRHLLESNKGVTNASTVFGCHRARFAGGRNVPRSLGQRSRRPACRAAN